MPTVNEIITDKIIKGLEAGNVPWQKPWHDYGTPKNLISNRMYTGINFFLFVETITYSGIIE